MSHPTDHATDLTTELAGLTLRSPLMTAAGCGGTGRELTAYADLDALGAFTTRTITLDPSPGSPSPRVVDTPSGILHHVGRQNPGLQGFLSTELPWLAQRRVPAVVSIAASSLAEYGELVRRLATSPGVAAVEVDLAEETAHQAGKVVNLVRRDLPREVPVLAKLPLSGDPLEAARAAVGNGADALVVGQGRPGLVFDPATLRPVLGAGTGAVSGPALLPLALHAVWTVHAALPDVPVVGAGGVRTGFDVVQMLLAGATAVQLGSVLLHDPSAPDRVTEELVHELERRGIPSPSGLVGLGHHSPEGTGR